MYYYILYGYLLYRYSYVLNYGYMTLSYGNRLRRWIFDKKSVPEIEKDWVLFDKDRHDIEMVIMN